MLKSACRTERYLIQRHPGRRGVRCPSSPESTKRQYTRDVRRNIKLPAEGDTIQHLTKVTVGTTPSQRALQALENKKNVAELSVHTSAFLQRRPLNVAVSQLLWCTIFRFQNFRVGTVFPLFGRVLVSCPVVRLRASTHGTPQYICCRTSCRNK